MARFFYCRSDLFVIIYVGVFSLLSGYLSILTYEYAAASQVSSAERAQATNILNMCFQVSPLSIASFVSDVLRCS